MKRVNLIIIILIFLLIINCNNDNKPNNDNKLDVFVSIIPQRFFAEKIGGELISVNVMVPSGADPHSYEPKPQQMKLLAKSKLYITIGGMSFEETLISKISSINPNTIIAKSDEGITRIPMIKHYHHNDEEENHHSDEDGLDPHIWLSPSLVKIQAENIKNALSSIDPKNSTIYNTNYKKFIEEINLLDEDIRQTLTDIKMNSFIVFHPAWGYFAKDYNLSQIPIEIEGKEPSPKELRELIDLTNEKEIKVIFVEPQFSTKSAEAIAKSINGELITINPLEENWLENLRLVAKKLKEIMN